MTISEKEYKQFRESKIKNRFLKHHVVGRLLDKHAKNELFKIDKLGNSEENRAIYQIEAGAGELKILIWSQMHGNESSGTAAIFDLLNYLAQNNADTKELLRKVCLYFVPMVNPDGAARFTRQNAYDIDINRDAMAQISAEARLLDTLRKKLKVKWAFNLHDQNTHYRVGYTSKPATISFLTPAFDFERTFDSGRTQSAQLIVAMNQRLQQLIPGCVGRYSDAYDARCFGDHFQKSGTNSILIESGGAANDPEKQVAREMNFHALLQGIQIVAEQKFAEFDFAYYEKIPLNRKDYFDLLVRNIFVPVGNRNQKMDLGITKNDAVGLGNDKENDCSKISDKGDLSVYHAYHEIDADGCSYHAGKVFTIPFDIVDEIKNKETELLANGYTAVYVTPTINCSEINDLKIRTLPEHTMYLPRPFLDLCADFCMVKNGKVVNTVIDGNLYSIP